MSDSSPIANLADLRLKEGGNSGKFAYRSARVGPIIGLQKLGCCVYVVPPGKRALPYHAHSLIEEMFVVLEGSGTLRHEGQELPLRAGDVVSARVGKAHQIINTSDGDLRYLAISANENADVVMYPDSNKVLAVSGAFGKSLWHITRISDATDYFAGEE